MKRLLCYAHFDENGQIRPFVKHALQAMSALCSDTIFVSNSPLTDGDRKDLSSLYSRVLVNDNTGYDFYMWKLGMETADLSEYDEVVLMNSSIYGPLFSMEDVFSRMDRLDCDFWGITECFQMQPHIQSYFLVFRKQVICSPAFQKFWGGILPYTNKLQVIQSYEVGLTQWLVESGFRPGVLCPLEQLGRYCRETGKRVRKKDNSSIKHAGELLHIGNPFLKRDAVRDRKVNWASVLPFLQRYGYPEHLVNEHTQKRPLACPLCGTPGKLTFKGIRDFLNLHDNNRHDYARCSSSSCGVLWRASELGIQRPTAISPDSIKPISASHHTPSLPSLLGKRPHGKILEIGCGNGVRLAKLRELGWEVSGYTTDTAAAEKLRELYIPIVKTLALKEIKEMQFDVILVTHGLELTSNPADFLITCHRMLNQGGFLYLNTPNADSLLLRIFRGYWSGFDAPRNKVIHTRKSIKNALIASGFIRENVTTSAMCASEYAHHSIGALMNKWKSPITDQIIKDFLPMFFMFTEIICNSLGSKYGEKFIVTAFKP